MHMLIFMFLIFLCWGSFLNVVAYRVLYDKSFFTFRSVCPFCNKIIYWYDNIPIISWVLLKCRCRMCKKPISVLYSFIEILTGIILTALFYYCFYFGYYETTIYQFISYFLFFSALIVATRTDLQAMVIPRLFSLWIVPLGVIFAYCGFTEITFYESLLGSILGYGILYSVSILFEYFTKKKGLGVGDMELLAMIGSFLGISGVWFSLTIGSLIGFLIGGCYILLLQKNRYTQIPFGPFLALGATLFFFFKSYLLNFFYN